MLGVLANSDGRADKVQAAVNIFLSQGAELIIHCGDIGGRHVLDALAPASSQGSVLFVWGDRDHDRTGLMRYGASLGITCFGAMGELEYAQKKLIVLHGQDKAILRKLLAEQQYDYLLCGHSAQTTDQTVGHTRILNPGSMRGPSGSVMLLDPHSGKVKIVPV
ncbi:metallophosphoesterase family protein [Fontivita pretiosa]|jgi:putative phosphoesterase|uniref:metallophosphoesterase family protein n=1 Tax=Fontivita pretiosa TaxID=2989684 RepID=UPI003D172A50